MVFVSVAMVMWCSVVFVYVQWVGWEKFVHVRDALEFQLNVPIGQRRRVGRVNGGRGRRLDQGT